VGGSNVVNANLGEIMLGFTALGPRIFILRLLELSWLKQSFCAAC
jgi:hypothetical protein